MLTLILETSTEKGCVVLAEKGIPIAAKTLPGGPELSKSLALEVNDLLKGAIPVLIAVGTGPGSYTGIRVSAALGKALAYGWKIPLIGFCSLKAFGPEPVLVDARSAGFYALLDQTPLLIAPTDPRLQNLSHIASPHPEIIQKRLPTAPIWHEKAPDPQVLAELSFRQFLEGGTAPFTLTYLSSP